MYAIILKMQCNYEWWRWKSYELFKVTTSAFNLLSIVCSINDKNENEDNVMFSNINKNRRKGGHTSSLGLSNKDYVTSDESITTTFSSSSNDKIKLMSLENKVHPIATWTEEDKSYGHGARVTC